MSYNSTATSRLSPDADIPTQHAPRITPRTLYTKLYFIAVNRETAVGRLFTTLVMVDTLWQNYTKPKVYKRNPENVLLYFEIPEFPYLSFPCISQRKPPFPKQHRVVVRQTHSTLLG